MVSSDMVRADAFRPHVGRHFATDGGPDPFTLIEVTAGPDGMAGNPQPFILIFRGPRAPVLAEGWREFSVDDARFAFHVMPIHTASRDHQDYQAVFN